MGGGGDSERIGMKGRAEDEGEVAKAAACLRVGGRGETRDTVPHPSKELKQIGK